MRSAAKESSVSQTDEQLMLDIRAGEMDSLGVLYTRYERMVRIALYRTAPDLPSDELDELTQEVFLAVAESAKNYREQLKFRSWLYGIAIRKARLARRTKLLRARLLRQKIDIKMPFPWSRDGDSAHQIELREALSKALCELSDNHRTVLLLHVVDGMTSQAIAELLDIRPRTARTRLHRARKKLLASAYADAWTHELLKEEA